jgi:hypothetical protein
LKIPFKTHNAKTPQQLPKVVPKQPLKSSPLPLEKIQRSSSPKTSSGERSPNNKSKITSSTSNNQQLPFLPLPSGAIKVAPKPLAKEQKIQEQSTSSSTFQVCTRHPYNSFPYQVFL